MRLIIDALMSSVALHIGMIISLPEPTAPLTVSQLLPALDASSLVLIVY